MNGRPELTDTEKKIIERMYKDRLPARQIAKIMDKPPVGVSMYIKEHLTKRPKPSTVIGKNTLEVVAKAKSSQVGGLRRYDDPFAAIEGSRKLLEAVNKYLQKHKDVSP
jgi:predicted transcriptional regulator